MSPIRQAAIRKPEQELAQDGNGNKRHGKSKPPVPNVRPTSWKVSCAPTGATVCVDRATAPGVSLRYTPV